MVSWLNWIRTSKPDQRLRDEEQHRVGLADLARRDRPRARARDLHVDVGIDDVVERAARAAHRDRADEAEHQRPPVEAAAPGCRTAASASEKPQGQNSSQKPIGRSQRASRA